MPEITRFYGIVIKMFFVREHNPPHFHALYGEYNGLINIKSLEMMEGDLPRKAKDLVNDWAKKNQKELMEMWDTKVLKKLEPLE